MNNQRFWGNQAVDSGLPLLLGEERKLANTLKEGFVVVVVDVVVIDTRCNAVVLGDRSQVGEVLLVERISFLWRRTLQILVHQKAIKVIRTLAAPLEQKTTIHDLVAFVTQHALPSAMAANFTISTLVADLFARITLSN
jgi:hypothetical protein